MSELREQRNTLTFVWWNTSLSPCGKSRASVVDKDFVAQCIKDLLSLDVDIVALGEVCRDDIRHIMRIIDDSAWRCHDATDTSGDIAVIFNSRKVNIISTRPLFDSYGSSRVKTCENLAMIYHDNIPFHFLVSHWPSRLYCSERDCKRVEYGVSLRRVIENINETHPPPHYIVLAGDYNDDPFSPSISEHLLATRDRERAQKNITYLYNPFWRKMGESEPYISTHRQQENTSVCGTYYYKSGRHTRWHTFDQIMFSSAFLQYGDLNLNEELTQIMRTEELERRLKDPKEIFDHLPVMSVIETRRFIHE